MEKKELYFDWRIYGGATLTADVPEAYPGGPSHKKGSPVYPIMRSQNQDGNSFSFIKPSVPALALNIAIKAAKEASKQQKRISYNRIVSPKGYSLNITPQNTPILYDFFESFMVSLIFSIQAIDIFSNTVIAQNLKKGTLSVKVKTKVKHYNSQQLQENFGIEYKLNEILPKILKINSLSVENKEIWDHFLELHRIRNRITHMKTEDFKFDDSKEDSLFYEFFKNDPKLLPKTTLELINYFSEGVNNSDWIESANSYLDQEEY